MGLRRITVSLAVAVLALGMTGCGSKGMMSKAGEEALMMRTDKPERLDVDAADAREFIPAGSFVPAGEGTWESPVIEAPQPFDELVYSWDAKLPGDQAFRLHFRVGFPDATTSPWLYAGMWGTVTDPVTDRQTPTFEFGSVEMDQLLLKKKAVTYQYRVVSEGAAPLTVIPSLHVITTDNDKVPEVAATMPDASQPMPVFDVPHRTQFIADFDRTGLCQSAALAAAFEYYGEELPLKTIADLTYDPEYDYPGIWPRTVGAAIQLDYEGYIDRFRSWKRVEDTLRQNKLILVSMRMPEEGDYIAPPYKSMEGHIIVLNGITADGRALVTDSALKPEKGTRCQWLLKDLEKVWWDQKGGVGMVIYKPEAPEKTLAEIEPFPGDRR